MWDVHHKEEYGDKAELLFRDEPMTIEDEQMIDEILNDDEIDLPSNTNRELQEARKKEIITRTKFLEQKILNKKHELFEEWSIRFFEVFQKAFQKFKNNLIELHLEEEKLNKLNENLDLALKNLEDTLNEINNEYINGDDNIENE